MLWAVGDNLCGSQLASALSLGFSLRARRQLDLTCLSLQIEVWGCLQGFHGLVPSCQHSSLHPSSQMGLVGILSASRFRHTSPLLSCVCPAQNS